MVRTDVSRAVWNAPTGLDSAVTGTQGSSVVLTDQKKGGLKPIAVTFLRSFKSIGRVARGARRLRISDQHVNDQGMFQSGGSPNLR